MNEGMPESHPTSAASRGNGLYDHDDELEDAEYGVDHGHMDTNIASGDAEDDLEEVYHMERGTNDGEDPGAEQVNTLSNVPDEEPEEVSETNKDDVSKPDPESSRKKKMFIAASIILVLAGIAAIIGVAVGGKKKGNDGGSTIVGDANDRACIQDQDRVTEKGRLVLVFEEPEGSISNQDKRAIEQAVVKVYNAVTPGCEDVYERFMTSATFDHHLLFQGPKSPLILTVALDTFISCYGCGAADEVMFGGPSQQRKARIRALKGDSIVSGDAFVDQLTDELASLRDNRDFSVNFAKVSSVTAKGKDGDVKYEGDIILV